MVSKKQTYFLSYFVFFFITIAATYLCYNAFFTQSKYSLQNEKQLKELVTTNKNIQETLDVISQLPMNRYANIFPNNNNKDIQKQVETILEKLNNIPTQSQSNTDWHYNLNQEIIKLQKLLSQANNPPPTTPNDEYLVSFQNILEQIKIANGTLNSANSQLQEQIPSIEVLKNRLKDMINQEFSNAMQNQEVKKSLQDTIKVAMQDEVVSQTIQNVIQASVQTVVTQITQEKIQNVVRDAINSQVIHDDLKKQIQDTLKTQIKPIFQEEITKIIKTDITPPIKEAVESQTKETMKDIFGEKGQLRKDLIKFFQEQLYFTRVVDDLKKTIERMIDISKYASCTNAKRQEELKLEQIQTEVYQLNEKIKSSSNYIPTEFEKIKNDAINLLQNLTLKNFIGTTNSETPGNSTS